MFLFIGEEWESLPRCLLMTIGDRDSSLQGVQPFLAPPPRVRVIRAMQVLEIKALRVQLGNEKKQELADIRVKLKRDHEKELHNIREEATR